MAIHNGGYNGDDPQPDDTVPYEISKREADYKTQHSDKEYTATDAVNRAIAEVQVEQDGRLSALDHTTVPHYKPTEE